MDIFAEGTRAKIRFNNGGMLVSIETLWGLKTPHIRSILLELKETIEKRSQSKSFLEEIDQIDNGIKNSDPELVILQLKFDIALEVYKTLVQEIKQRENAQSIAQEKAYWSKLLLQKQREEDGNLSVEQIAAKLKEISTKD